MKKRFPETFLWWLTFLIATFSLSKVFESVRNLGLGLSAHHIELLLLWTFILVTNLLIWI